MPLNIASLAQQYADVVRLEWTYTCDALVHLGNSRPKVFLRATPYPRREAFTLAHELGHIAIPWHVGYSACAAVGGEAISTDPSGYPLAFTPRSRVEIDRDLEEQEATRFAGRVLLPSQYVSQFASTLDVGAWLAAVDATGMSAMAGVLALSKRLLPGFAFDIHLPDGRSLVSSSGTRWPSQDRREWQATAEDYGVALVADRVVNWYRFGIFGTFRMADDSRTTSAILKDAVLASFGSLSWPKATASREVIAFKRASSVASGVLSKDRSATPGQALAVLRQRFAHEDELPRSLLASSEFDLFLHRKAYERMEKLGRL